MRADRLVATVLLLQSRGRVTAAELADALDVSVPTARRDLEALSAAGVPVYPSRGRGGGWELVGGARTDLTGLTLPEARGLFLRLGPGARHTPETQSALRKLLRALPSTFREEAAAAAAAVVVDPESWGGLPAGRPAVVTDLQTAVVRRRQVVLTYARAGQPASTRVVDPWGLVDKDGLWYLIAGTAQGRRTFRLDRVVSVELTDVAAARPDGFELAEAWQEVVERVESSQRVTVADVEVPARHTGVLRAQFGQHVQEVGPAEEPGWVVVRVSAPSPLMVAQHLAGWGRGLRVTGPAAVQAELARIGAELTTAYASGAVGRSSREPGVTVR